MIIKKGIVYEGRLHIRIPYDRKVEDITICEKVKCRYAIKQNGDKILSVGFCIECFRCDTARSIFVEKYEHYIDRHYSYVPYDN
jgi:hypothetical protein